MDIFQSMDLPAEHITPAVTFLAVIVEMKTVAWAGAADAPGLGFAASYQTLSVVIQIDER